MKEENLQELLAQMTLEEKLGQLTQTTGEHFIGKVDSEMVETGPEMGELVMNDESIYTIGSVLGVSSAKITNAIQKNYLTKNRLHIPLLFMHDAIHGYRTIFPIPLALSCSWDKELLYKTGEYTATELRASGIHVDFSPMTDLVRDARWGRVMESFGEDHILSGELGKAMISGYQKEKNGKIGAEGVAACLKHFAAYGAAEAGIEIEMVSTTYMQYGKDFLNENEELQGKIDKAVMKILKLKNEFGLFENPYVEEKQETVKILAPETLQFAKEAAKETCVLLKNKGILPLKKEIENVLILGPFAKTRELLGNWQCKGKFEECISLEEGMKQVLPNAKINAYETLEECPEGILENANVVLITIGESWELSGEGRSSASLELSLQQQDMIREVNKRNKSIACIAFSGRPLALSNIINDIPTLLWCWYPGTCGGRAVAELIVGEGSPSGKLTMSFPRITGQAPLHYNEYRCGRPANESTYSSRYQDCEAGPLFPFGYGLSYAKIKYSNFQISGNKISDNKTIKLSMELENNSDFSYKETVIVYMQDPVSNNVRPIRELLTYQKVFLCTGEKKKVTFEVSAQDLKYWNNKLEKVIEKGSIYLYINDMEQKVFEIQY